MHASTSGTESRVTLSRNGAGGFNRSWIMLGCAWLLGFAMYAPMLCIPPMAHIIKKEMGVSHAAVGFLFCVPVTVVVLLATPAGFFADRLGTQKAVLIGSVVMAFGSLMRVTSTSFASLLLFTSIYGIGFSIIFPNLPKLVGSWFPREKVGLATGVYATGITTAGAVALAVTLPLVFPLTHTIQGTFFFWSMPAVLAAILWWAVAKDPPLSSRVRSDPQRATHNSSPSYSLWKDKNMWLIALLLFFNDVHFYTWSGWSPALFMDKGASPELAALIASFRGWVGLPMIFLMPWASYRVGLRKPFLWGSGIALALAAWAALYIPVPMGWPLMALIGIATSGTFSMILALPLELLPSESAGTASGIVLSIGYLGSFLGPWVAGLIADATGNFDLALLMLLGTGLMWAASGFILPESGLRATQQR
ncbi:MAG: major facilitator superfamily 1 [Deltaproteobacteria bacterium]|nr:major facilitator superfamily 1 [Deltaproteobacteria bacterium]